MTFNTFLFLYYFLPISLFLYWVIKNIQYRNVFLIFASVIFYACTGFVNLGYLLFIIGITLFAQKLVLKAKTSTSYIVFISVIILCWVGLKFLKTENGVMPLGISFFTFSAISLLTDTKRRLITDKTGWVDNCLYILFFPKLLSGPIELFKNFQPQIKRRTITVNDIYCGIKQFMVGLSKKMILANSLQAPVDIIFNEEIVNLTITTLWGGAILYSLQIYFDFSAYSDMAIGVARLFGFKLKDNFNYPYLSKSVSEFWRRWHISLSQWFKEYVYFPLGGSRKGCIRTFINIFIVFLLCGLWHGQEGKFICWGLWLSLFVILEHAFSLLKLKSFCDSFFALRIKQLYCLLVIMFGWVIFRSPSIAFAGNYIKSMLALHPTDPDFGISFFINKQDFFVLAISCFIALGGYKIFQRFKITNVIADTLIFISFIYSQILIITFGTQTFIYFNF